MKGTWGLWLRMKSDRAFRAFPPVRILVHILSSFNIYRLDVSITVDDRGIFKPVSALHSEALSADLG